MDHEQNRSLGRRHPAIVRLRALRRDAASRARESVLMAEGLHLAREALASDLTIETVVVSPRLTRSRRGTELLAALERRGLACLRTSDAVLDSLQDARSAQPILMVLKRPAWSIDDLLGSRSPLVAVVHGIQDPGNLGTLARTAEAAGASGILAAGPCADPFHPRAVRASAGSLLRLPLVALESGALVDAIRERAWKLYATDAGKGTPYHDCDFRGSSAVCFGGEGAGLPAELTDAAVETARIPLRAGVESLSVAAAAAVVLFEAARQRALREDGEAERDRQD